MNQPIENRPTFNICNSSLAHSLLYHMYYKIDQHDSSSCNCTFGLLHFMWSNTVSFAVLKGWHMTQSRQWVIGSWVMGQMGRQMWMGHVGYGSVPQNTWLMIRWGVNVQEVKHSFLFVYSSETAGAWHAISINKGNYLVTYLLAYLLNNTQWPITLL